MAWASKTDGAKVWTAFFRDEHGAQRQKRGYADKASTEKLAQKLEDECARIRDGLASRGDRTRRDARGRSVSDHVRDYREALKDRGTGVKHQRKTASLLLELFELARVRSLDGLGDEGIAKALAKIAAAVSGQKANDARTALRSFATWLDQCDRIEFVPKTIRALKPAPEPRIRVRRALTAEELVRLLDAAEAGPDMRPFIDNDKAKGRGTLTGFERAMIYRLVMATGFRANEVRTLVPDRFHLGEKPTVTVTACFSKRGKRSGRDDVQPIRESDAERFRAWIASLPLGRPIVCLPDRTADMLKVDLKAAGIPYRDEAGRVIDFHALRVSFITDLHRRGVSPKAMQTLARHSTITLTLGPYTKLDEGEVRGELEGEKK